MADDTETRLETLEERVDALEGESTEEPLTEDDINGMSAKDINDNWARVQKALKK